MGSEGEAGSGADEPEPLLKAGGELVAAQAVGAGLLGAFGGGGAGAGPDRGGEGEGFVDVGEVEASDTVEVGSVGVGEGGEVEEGGGEGVVGAGAGAVQVADRVELGVVLVVDAIVEQELEGGGELVDEGLTSLDALSRGGGSAARQ